MLRADPHDAQNIPCTVVQYRRVSRTATGEKYSSYRSTAVYSVPRETVLKYSQYWSTASPQLHGPKAKPRSASKLVELYVSTYSYGNSGA